MHSMTKFTAVVTAVTASIALAEPAFAVTNGASSAFGISAGGIVPISPTPAVAAPAGQRQPLSKSLVSVPPNSVLSARVLAVSARPGRARASVTDLRIAKAQLSAHVLTATCVNGKGDARLVRATIGGRTLESAPKPNTTVPVALDRLGTVTVTLNKQERRSDGRLTVTALSVRVPVGGLSQSVDVSSVTCGPGRSGSGSGSGAGNGDAASGKGGNQAPVPTPVKQDLPVTG